MLAEILHKVAQQQYGEKESKYNPRPSLAGPERCQRQMVYWRFGFPPAPLPGRAVLVFDDGNWHEQLTADWVRRTAFKLHSEQMKIECAWKGYNFILRGKIDGIVQDIEENDYLLEHKAVNHFAWQRFAEGKPSLDHLTQSCIYLRGLEEVSPIRKGILLLKNKNTAQYLEFEFEYVPEKDLCFLKTMMTSTEGMEKTQLNLTYPNIVESAFVKFQTVEDYAQRKALPIRQYKENDWHCDYCQYNQTCWEGYEKEFEQLATGVDLTEEVETLCGYYLQTSAQAKEMEKEEEKLKDQIKEILKQKQVREGVAGKYIIKNILTKRTTVDQSLIPPEILKICQKESFSERLNIKLKEEVKKK